MGTTKLTRKEILSEDPVHNYIMHWIEFFRFNGPKVIAAAVVIGVLAVIAYLGYGKVQDMKDQAQERFSKGLDFLYADVKPDATDNPYSKGPTPAFQSETAKYQAAAKEFSAIASGHIYGKLTISARYCLGIAQLRLGQNKEAMQNLESVASNSSNRTLGFMAKRTLAINDLNLKNYKGAQELLDGMIKDPQCDIQKEDLSIQLSRVFVAQGKRDDAIRVLREATKQNPSFGKFRSQLMAELEKILKTP